MSLSTAIFVSLCRQRLLLPSVTLWLLSLSRWLSVSLSFGVSLDSFSGFSPSTATSLSIGGSLVSLSLSLSRWLFPRRRRNSLPVSLLEDGWMNLLLFFAFAIRMMKGINQVLGTKFNAIKS
ncbi:hypothetical protein DY000_02029286 [Brassica cretica]|uniref:Uncharacterized protein n=1 Tax=Brassica cretica TaxID=69181 RepID=A0ABQ7DDT8_BRACR|nr:hypothetical protein DY000_02029286 [Brassica cretica]